MNSVNGKSDSSASLARVNNVILIYFIANKVSPIDGRPHGGVLNDS